MKKLKIKIILPIILLISLALDLAALAYVKNKKQPPLANSANRTVAKTPQSIDDKLRHSLTYYITTSQELLNKARILANNQSQTESDKQEILAVVNQALDLANQAIAAYPNDDRSYVQRAKIYQALVPFTDQAIGHAIQDFQTAIEINNQNPDYHTRLANLYRQTGSLENAALSFYNAYLLSLTDVQSLYNLADTLEKSGQLSQADHYLEKLISLLPANDENLVVLKKRQENIQSLLASAKLENLAEPGNLTQTGLEQKTAVNGLIGTQELPLEQAAINNQVIIANSEAPSALLGEETAEKTTITTNSKSGQATITAGKTNVIINNEHITANKQILITTADNPQNKVIFVSSRKENSWFQVSLDSPASGDINFTWWIVD